MTERRYKYMRADFGPLPVKLEHLTIYLNFLPDYVEATNCLEMTAKVDLREISLDANNLEIVRVESCMDAAGEGSPLEYEYVREKNRLLVRLRRAVAKGEKFLVRTVTRCVPSDHILEGIYRDATPPGAPQQYMSQCQQWGFQRIMPIFDDCRAKCTMTTTMEADRAYTHLISNGNVSRSLNPDGRPVAKADDPSRQVITYENPVPMAPYLFIACAGTWDALVDEVVYDSGRRVRLEYLVPPGAAGDARVPMEMLKEAVLWIGRTQDYEYTGDTYRTICMNKSNFGGMENVGNTTIVTDAALVTEYTLDMALLYAHAVIVHEFEHNQCGSETTMETPFDVWLNEAYTVDVERQFMEDLFDPSFMRLTEMDGIRNPLLGPLAMEDAGHVGRIVRDGFNDPDELIDGVTYVKAAEVIRMLRLVVGAENFIAGKRLYFSRYRDGNADTDQFFECFEEVSGVSLGQFKREWLYRIGYPKVVAFTEFDTVRRVFRVRFRQDLTHDEAPFHLPIELALVDGEGNDVPGSARVFQLRDAEGEAVFENISSRPAFVSLNRDYSFYGTLVCPEVRDSELIQQARIDPNVFNRVDAFRRITDRERIVLLKDPGAGVGENWLDLFGEFLRAGHMSPALKSYFLRIDEQPLDRGYATWFRELVAAREALMKAVSGRYRSELLDAFKGLDTYSSAGRTPGEGIEDRMLKQILLELISVDDTAESHGIIQEHFRAATTATDRVSSLICLNRSSSPERRQVMEEAYEAWHGHLSGYANYLRCVSNGTSEDVFEMIEREKNRPGFDVTVPTWSRSLFVPMAANTKMVWTDRGIGWVADTVIELAPINATTAGRLLNTFQHVKRLKPDLREKVTTALRHIVERVSSETCRPVHAQARSYLEG